MIRALLVLFLPVVIAQSVSPGAIASQYQLGSSTSLPFPTATLSATAASSYLGTSGWQITKNGSISQKDDVSFANDPFATSNSAPVFTVDYPTGSYSEGTGGTEFSTYFNNSGTPFGTVLLSYEVAFDTNFDWVKGGKLPGLRGGSLSDCSGGVYSSSCFSMRLMWRAEGAGEAYAYMPAPFSLCSRSNVLCNQEGYGTSLSRGSFSFVSGAWNNISLLVQLNNPVRASNGLVYVYHNGVLAVQFTGLQIRLDSSVTGFTGLFFSGRRDIRYPTDQHTYFRNIQMWGSTAFSSSSSAASSIRAASFRVTATLAFIVANAMVFISLL
ncbi:polysaccharide lyase family 14 protein [Hydnum rufescens UP504]|uniref:Polysaccharide lyase family 14 protein n=1 Tax=Hydnum rufescens UP504 TaxID=1448309 RepID=A0A9P6E1Y8_9AGAM|nr:polysaccharide lyase family 14 protein [Hydnum rufescens UP504]